jgi:SAM-dependent methyltransferase
VTSSIWAAGRYEAVAERIAGIAAQVVAAADARIQLRDAAVVDLACGTGSAALAAASRGARVTAVDLTPELTAIGARKASATGLSIDWRVGDAADTGLPAGRYDAAVSNMGLIFVEPASQVAEITRLLKMVGVLAFSAWVRTPDNPFFTPIVEVLGPQPQADHTPDQWGDAEVIHARLRKGFDDVTIEHGNCTWAFDSMPAALHFLRAESPMHVDTFRRVEAAQQQRLAAAFESALRPHLDESGAVRFTSPYVVVTAARRA